MIYLLNNKVRPETPRAKGWLQSRSMDLPTVHDAHMAINLVHRFVYFVPDAAEEYAALGLTGRGTYFGSRAAPLGPVPAASCVLSIQICDGGNPDLCAVQTTPVPRSKASVSNGSSTVMTMRRVPK